MNDAKEKKNNFHIEWIQYHRKLICLCVVFMDFHIDSTRGISVEIKLFNVNLKEIKSVWKINSEYNICELWGVRFGHANDFEMKSQKKKKQKKNKSEGERERKKLIFTIYYLLLTVSDKPFYRSHWFAILLMLILFSAHRNRRKLKNYSN